MVDINDVHAIAAGSKSFRPFIKYGDASSGDFKYTSHLADVNISFYHIPEISPRLLDMILFSGIACNEAELHIRIDWFGTSGCILSEFGTFLIACLTSMSILLLHRMFYISGANCK